MSVEKTIMTKYSTWPIVVVLSLMLSYPLYTLWDMRAHPKPVPPVEALSAVLMCVRNVP